MGKGNSNSYGRNCPILYLRVFGLKDWGFLFAFTPFLFLMEEERKWIVRRWWRWIRHLLREDWLFKV